MFRQYFLFWPVWLPLLTMWVVLVRLLGAQWSFYPQYTYGWAVAFLCVYFVWSRREEAQFTLLPANFSSGVTPRARAWIFAAIGLFALFWLPLRILQEGHIIWRAASYGLAIVGCVLTLLIFALSARKPSAMLFPVLFFLVAIPWPTPIEAAVVRLFTGWNTVLTVEIMSLVGIPVLQHGNIIQTTGGLVGVDEACSGIRSFQACLMISIGFGELQRLSAFGRVVLASASVVLAFGLNVARTSLLTWMASSKGAGAIESWHDPAGVTILLGCLVSLWGTAEWMGRQRRKGQTSVQAGDAASEASQLPGIGATLRSSKGPRLFTGGLETAALGLVIWVLFSELATSLWFGNHRAQAASSVEWYVEKPAEAGRYYDEKQSEEALKLLGCDSHVSVGWNDEEGHTWRAFYFRWLPAKTLRDRARTSVGITHRPEHCLPATGKELVRQESVQILRVHGQDFAFRTYRFEDQGWPLLVFHCLAEDGVHPGIVSNLRENTMNRLRAAWEGHRIVGQRSLLVAVWGHQDLEMARTAVAKELATLVRIGNSPVK